MLNDSGSAETANNCREAVGNYAIFNLCGSLPVIYTGFHWSNVKRGVLEQITKFRLFYHFLHVSCAT